MKKLLVTGSKGFIGKNLLTLLRPQAENELMTYDVEDDPAALLKMVGRSDAILHFAGVNRPKEEQEFFQGNTILTLRIVEHLISNDRRIPIIMPSSIQAELDNPYGRSKRAAEDALFSYAEKTGADVCVYRLPNVFGKWCRPNYNSVVATFCYNIARGMPISVNDPDTILNMVYIDDVVDEFMAALKGTPSRDGHFCSVSPIHTIKLGEIANLIHSFRESRQSLVLPDMADPFTKKLYSTYLSYLPVDEFGYTLKMNADERGSFTEVMKSFNGGQVSVNISCPGITKGDHWHRTKNEKFLVVAGNGVIRFRHMDSNEIVEYKVSAEQLEVVDIPVGYTHNIVNTGPTDMVTLMWANEMFDPLKADTYFEPVD